MHMHAPHPELTEVESLKLENLRLAARLLDRAVQDWQAKVAALKAAVEQTRAGWTFTPQTGQWTRSEAPPADT